MASQTVLIHSTLFYTQKCLKVNLMLSAAEVYSVKVIQKKRSTQEENMEKLHCLQPQRSNNAVVTHFVEQCYFFMWGSVECVAHNNT